MTMVHPRPDLKSPNSNAAITQGHGPSCMLKWTCRKSTIYSIIYDIVALYFRTMEDENGNVIANKTAPPLSDLAPEQFDPASKEEFMYGWRRIRPKCLQFLNCPAALIIVFCVYNMFQGWYIFLFEFA